MILLGLFQTNAPKLICRIIKCTLQLKVFALILKDTQGEEDKLISTEGTRGNPEGGALDNTKVVIAHTNTHSTHRINL